MIRETFPRNRFWLEKREREIESTTDQVVFWLDGYCYSMDLFRFKSVMEKLDIDATEEIMLLSVETVDKQSFDPGPSRNGTCSFPDSYRK